MSFKDLNYRIKGVVLGLYSRWFVKRPAAEDIPVVINNFNRLTTLKSLIDSLTARGVRRIIILDNDSTYEPLLEWYKQCPWEVINLGTNLGFKAVWRAAQTRKLRRGWYIYTDSDVELDPLCPSDFISHMLEVMTVKHPYALKVGLSLRIDDLPDCYEARDAVIAHEQKFWNDYCDGMYRAPVDTTMALYRPHSGLNRSRSAEAYRLAPPYSLRHLPWYADSSKLSEEEQFYRRACSKPTMWSKSS